jgi:hypothetical protein
MTDQFFDALRCDMEKLLFLIFGSISLMKSKQASIDIEKQFSLLYAVSQNESRVHVNCFLCPRCLVVGTHSQAVYIALRDAMLKSRILDLPRQSSVLSSTPFCNLWLCSPSQHTLIHSPSRATTLAFSVPGFREATFILANSRQTLPIVLTNDITGIYAIFHFFW